MKPFAVLKLAVAAVLLVIVFTARPAFALEEEEEVSCDWSVHVYDDHFSFLGGAGFGYVEDDRYGGGSGGCLSGSPSVYSKGGFIDMSHISQNFSISGQYLTFTFDVRSNDTSISPRNGEVCVYVSFLSEEKCVSVIQDGNDNIGNDPDCSASVCGDGICNPWCGEDATTCPSDCDLCGNGTCDPGENCTNCPSDCGGCDPCGNGVCDPWETCLSCPKDCGTCPPTCQQNCANSHSVCTEDLYPCDNTCLQYTIKEKGVPFCTAYPDICSDIYQGCMDDCEAEVAVCDGYHGSCMLSCP